VAKTKCLSCGWVGGTRITEVQVERAGMRQLFMLRICITCTVSMVHWMEDVSAGVQPQLPLVPDSKVTRRAKRSARSSRVYARLSTGVESGLLDPVTP
jgi:hypothetical protein